MPPEYRATLNNGVAFNDNNKGNGGSSSDIEYMRNIVYISREFGFTFDEIMNMPFNIFLSYVRWAYQLKLEENPAFVEKLQEMEVLKQEEPEYDKLMNLKI